MDPPQIAPSKPNSLLNAIVLDNLDSLCAQIPKRPVWIPKTDFSTLAFWALQKMLKLRKTNGIIFFMINFYMTAEVNKASVEGTIYYS